MASLNSRDDVISTKTVWLLFAVAINALEFFIPRVPFFPWLKPGFANIITIIWIIEFGAIDALLYSLLRVWIVGFFFGFSFLTMSLALSGGVLSTLAMSVLWAGLGKRRILGTVGMGVCGALFHNFGQIMAVYGLMAANTRLFYQVPVMFVASVVFGGLVGLLAPLFRDALVSCEADASASASGHSFVPHNPEPATASEYGFSLVLLAGSCAIVFTDSLPALVAAACGATAVVQVQRKGSLKALVSPLSSFWVLFAFIAFINLFFSYGVRIERFPLFTHEGVDQTVRQWLRLWTWLEVSFLFSYFNFHAVMFSVLARLFPGHRSTLFAGVLGLEYFPAIAGDSRAYAKKAVTSFVRRPLGTLRGMGSRNLLKRVTKALYGIIIRRMDA
jgi:heptaprenyl diphosphate synthase